MSYDIVEESKVQGNPIELYYFSNGVQSWGFTSADVDFFTDQLGLNVEEFSSRPIRRSSVAQGLEVVKNAVKLEVPPNFEIVDLFRGIPSSSVLSVTIIRAHILDPAVPLPTPISQPEFSVLWTGRVLGAKIEPDRAELNCEPITISLKRNGLRRLYSRNCTHVLYGTECGVNKTLYRTPAIVQSINGNVVGLNVSSFSPDELAGGFLEKTDGTSKVMINTNIDANVTLAYSPNELEEGDSVYVYRGCQHTVAACNSFSNIDNFGGFPWIPSKNPFDTGIF